MYAPRTETGTSMVRSRRSGEGRLRDGRAAAGGHVLRKQEGQPARLRGGRYRGRETPPVRDVAPRCERVDCSEQRAQFLCTTDRVSCTRRHERRPTISAGTT